MTSDNKENTGWLKLIFSILLIFFLLAGEVQCIIKTFKSNWKPIGTREIVYTVGSLTGLGGIIGWIEIEDN